MCCRAMSEAAQPPRKRIAQIGFITIGLPFAAFKILFGLTMPVLWPGKAAVIGGGALVVLGILDLIVNALNSAFMLFRGRLLTQVCLLAILFDLLGKKQPDTTKIRSADFGTALDVMLSFSLVALCVGLGLLPRFGENERLLWNLSVVVNVIGAGVSRLMVSILRAD
jgi:hypothetical protein